MFLLEILIAIMIIGTLVKLRADEELGNQDFRLARIGMSLSAALHLQILRYICQAKVPIVPKKFPNTKGF